MSTQIIYSCDWCEKKSPIVGAIGDHWTIAEEQHTGKKEHLCDECSVVRSMAISEARYTCVKKAMAK